MHMFLRDVRHGGRLVLRDRAFFAIVIGTMVLGIATLTAVFSVVHAVLLAPLPYPDADRLVSLQSSHSEYGSNVLFSLRELAGLREDHEGLDDLAAVAMANGQLAVGGEPQQLRVLVSTPNLLSLLGARPAVGRNFRPDEGHRGDERVALLSDRFWKQVLGSDPGVVGSTLQLAGDGVLGSGSGRSGPQSVLVVGVLPSGFRAPFGNYDPDLWIADSMDSGRASGASHAYLFARLAPGAQLPSARASLRAAYDRLQQESGHGGDGWRAEVVPLRTLLAGSVERPLELLLLGGLMVFAVALANTANLLLAKTGSRYFEIATRCALGADRWRLLRQLAGESLVPATISGGAGLGMAWLMLRFLERFDVGIIPSRFEVGIDPAVFGLVSIVTLGLVVFFAMVPALAVSRRRIAAGLQGRSTSGRRRPGGTRFALVGVQVSLALVLTVAAGLLMASLLRLQAVDPGFDEEGVLTARLSLAQAFFPDPSRRAAFFQRLLPEIRSLPGVESAGLVNDLPFSGISAATRIAVENSEETSTLESAVIRFCNVSPGYLEAMRIPLESGRYFDSMDLRQPAVIVSRSAGRMLWGDADPVGRRVKVGGRRSHNRWAVVRGVVGDVLQDSLTRESEPTLYLPSVTSGEMTLVMRSSPVEPERLAGALRQRVRTLFAEQPVHDVAPLAARVEGSLSRSRLSAWLMTLLGAITLLLASLGVYGATWHAVVERRDEIGIRYAFGAEPFDILQLVFARIVPWLLVGLAVGIAGAYALGGYFGSLLYGVENSDPLILWGTSTVVGVVALLGSYVPTRRAAQVDPASIMKV